MDPAWEDGVEVLALSAEADIFTTTPAVRRRVRRFRHGRLVARSLEGPAGERLGRSLSPKLDTRPAPKPAAAPPRRVLVADDEPAMRLLLRVNLPSAGYEVVEAADGEAALARVREQPFDLLVLDVMMPGMSGFELAERLRADPATAYLPVVFMSARADEEDVRRGLALGAFDYVTKPFDPLRLGEHLNALLEGASSGASTRAGRSRLLDDNQERQS